MGIKESFQSYVSSLDEKIKDKELRASELKGQGKEVKADKVQKKAGMIKTRKDCFNAALDQGAANFYEEIDEICASEKGEPHARKLRIAALNEQNRVHSTAFLAGSRQDNADKNQVTSEIVMKCDKIASDVTNLIRSVLS
jgi:hypothetical protein